MHWKPSLTVWLAVGITWALIGVVIWQLQPRAEVIRYDAGGPIAARSAQIRNGEPAQIVGYCASACTMHLLTGCVTPGARLVFHGPQTTDPAAFEHFSALMARHYPPAIAQWFMAEGRYGRRTISGADAITMGAREC